MRPSESPDCVDSNRAAMHYFAVELALDCDAAAVSNAVPALKEACAARRHRPAGHDGRAATRNR